MNLNFSILLLAFIIPLFSSAETAMVNGLSGWINAVLKTKPDGSLDISELVQQMKNLPKNAPYEQYLKDLQKMGRDIEYGYIKVRIKKLCQDRDPCIEEATTSLLQTYETVSQEMKEMILFPRYYKSTGNITFISTNTLNAVKCNYCSSESIKRDILRGTDETYSDVYRSISQKGADCIEAVLTELFSEMDNIRIPQKCLEEEYQNNQVCQTINTDIRIRESRIKSLTDLWNNLSNTESDDACLPKMSDKIDSIKDFLGEIQESKMCSPLEIGEKRTMPTFGSIGAPYTVQREQDGSYSVALTMTFMAGRNYDGEVSKTQVPGYYKEKVQECLQQASPKLLGPNGEKLNIIISSPKNMCESLQRQSIKIMPSYHRSSMIAYASDIDCPTILHEVLHQFGLGDEYDELRLLKKEDPLAVPEEGMFSRVLQEIEYTIFGTDVGSVYDCRFISDNSIMGDHRERWEDTVEGEEQSSLLSPRHFNLIMYGRCSEKNQTFIECNKQAYWHSSVDSSCLERKKECESLYHSH